MIAATSSLLLLTTCSLPHAVPSPRPYSNPPWSGLEPLIAIEPRQLAAAAAPKHAKASDGARPSARHDAPTVALPSISSQLPVITRSGSSLPRAVTAALPFPEPLFVRARASTAPTRPSRLVRQLARPRRTRPFAPSQPPPSPPLPGASPSRNAVPTASAASPSDGRTAASRPLWPRPRSLQTIASASRSTNSRMATGLTEEPVSVPAPW